MGVQSTNIPNHDTYASHLQARRCKSVRSIINRRHKSKIKSL